MTRRIRCATWTKDAIVGALQEWALKHGRQPAAIDWYWAGYGHPAASTVYYQFGSWNAAVSAAGFTPRLQGRQPHGVTRQSVLSLLVKPTSIRTLRDELDMTEAHARKMIWKLNKLGLVQRVERGVWVAA